MLSKPAMIGDELKATVSDRKLKDERIMSTWVEEVVRFARDSPLEGDGFELPVPRELISAGGRNPAASGSTSALDGATRAQLGGAERTVARKWRKTGIFPPFRDAPRVKSVVWRNQVSSKINGLV